MYALLQYLELSLIFLYLQEIAPAITFLQAPLILEVIGFYYRLHKSLPELESVLRNLNSKFGPILRIGSRPSIFVSDRSFTYQALIQNGAVFANRPPAATTRRIVSCNQHTVGSAPYGPIWRILRRNLTSEMLHPCRVKSYSHARKWTLQVLKKQLTVKSSGDHAVLVVEHLRYAMFCLLASFMCFGDKLDETQIKKIEEVQRCMILNL